MTANRKISSTRPENLGLYRGAPVVREVKRRNYLRAVDGDGGDHKALGAAPFRSLLERDLRTLLGANPEIEAYGIECHTLEYFIPDGYGGFNKHLYIPDVVCRYRSGQIVVLDAKAAFLASLPSWTMRMPHIEEAYRLDHGVPFVVVKEDVIRTEPRLSNCQIMLRHHYITQDIYALLRVRDVLNELGFPTTISEVVSAACLNSIEGTCRAYTAIMNLAITGEIDLDLGVPFSGGTIVREGTLS